MNSDALAVFDALLKAMDSEEARLTSAAKDAVLNGQFATARQLLAKAERIEQLEEQVRQIQEEWKHLDEAPLETSTPKEKTRTRRTIPADTQEDETPEAAVISQLFGARRRGRRRRQSVNKTPGRAYRIPILDALEQLGGKGGKREVLEIVYERMKEHLTDDDLKWLPSGTRKRWSETAEWERFYMVKEGLLCSDSPRGVWEITEAGRAYLERARLEDGGKSKNSAEDPNM